jgi:hypothetical protein
MASINSIPPNLQNKSLFSGKYAVGSRGQTMNAVEYEIPATVANISNFTSNVGTGNIAIPLNSNTLEYIPSLFPSNITSNGMVNTTNFNIIKLDIDNSKGVTDIVLDVYYGRTNNLSQASKKYSTIIERGELFYRSYPVANEFFNFTCKNPDSSDRAKFQGRATLSRYTNFTTPNQLSDKINRFNLSEISRAGNSFENDILIGRVSDVVKTDRIGITNSILANEMTFWNSPTNLNFTANVTSDIVARSDNVGDTMDIFISGKDTLDKKVEETITLSGTSNVFGILSYKLVDDIVVSSNGTNSGNVVIERVGTGEVLNYMDANAGRSTSMIYCCPENTTAIVKDFNLNGFTTLNTESKVKLFKVVDNIRSILVYQNNTRDNAIDDNQELNIALQAGETLYGKIDSSQITSNLGDSYFAARLNILEYAEPIEKII